MTVKLYYWLRFSSDLEKPKGCRLTALQMLALRHILWLLLPMECISTAWSKV